MTDGSDQKAFQRALHESTAIADRIREAIADAPPKLVMLALSDLLQEQLTHLVMVEPDKSADPSRQSVTHIAPVINLHERVKSIFW
jgi:hypothetical protein